ncbi:hypothetical protein HMPREF1486_01973 [Streptomyces sp. HPH0547]|nr:hypothetical protein HMPREF1486_01973 [Streptomyces sp. HPH0547]
MRRAADAVRGPAVQGVIAADAVCESRAMRYAGPGSALSGGARRCA